MVTEHFQLLLSVHTFINGKPAVIKDIRRLKNPTFWLVIFPVVPSNKIPLFYKDLITFILSFILLFLRVISKPLLDVNFLLSSFISLLI